MSAMRDGLNHALDHELLPVTPRERARAASSDALREFNAARRLGISVRELRELDALIGRRINGVPE